MNWVGTLAKSIAYVVLYGNLPTIFLLKLIGLL